MADFLSKLTQQSLQGRTRLSKESQKWFLDTVRGMTSTVVQQRIISSARQTGNVISTPLLGRMYTFGYWAKHADTLPYFDKFPLIIMVRLYRDGFRGINFHYLRPVTRAVLLGKLMDFAAANINVTDKTRLIVTHNMLAAATTYKEIQPCVKRYLYNQVRTQIVVIPATNWETAIYLPTESFEGTSSTKVWRDSHRQIG